MLYMTVNAPAGTQMTSLGSYCHFHGIDIRIYPLLTGSSNTQR